MSIYFGLSRVMTVKTANFRGDIYKNDKNAELQCSPEPIDFSLVKLHFWWCSREAENKKGFADTWSNWRIKWRTTKEKQSSRKCNKWTSPTKNQQRAPPSGRKSSAKSSLLLLFLILLSTFLNTQIQISYQLYFFFKSVFRREHSNLNSVTRHVNINRTKIGET